MKSRTQIADLLKGIAVLLMIQVHVIELFATIEIAVSLKDILPWLILI